MKEQLYIYADLPRAGFANMLYPWARAIVLSREKNAKMLAPQWVKFKRIGPWLRREKYKRYYLNMITNNGYVKGFKRLFILGFKSRFNEDEIDGRKDGVCCVHGMGNYFGDFNKERDFVKAELLKITNPMILSGMKKLPSKFIGVHIRRGDFATIGFARDNDYYIRAISKAMEQRGMQGAPILVFSDAFPAELEYLKIFDNLTIMPKASALQDLLSLASATVLIGTNRSTFSEWALFLGGMRSYWEEDIEDTAPDKNIFDYDTV